MALLIILRKLTLRLNKGVEKLYIQDYLKQITIIKKGHLGVNKFNMVSIRSKVELVPLGGINKDNLSKVKSVRCNSFACLSAIKKKAG